MKGRLLALLIRIYPRSWRDRYAAELESLILRARADGDGLWSTSADVTRAGARERLISWGLWAEDPGEQRLRSGVLLVLASWALLVLGGGGVQKFSEHWEATTPASTRALPAGAFQVLLFAGSLGCILLAAGMVIALPALVRLLRSGDRPSRRAIVRALGTTVLAVLTTVCLAVWARQLNGAQRNGADSVYSAAFLLWVSLLVVTVFSWTAAAVVAARHIALSERVLRAEARLAIGVALAALVATAAASVWWGALAADAPWVLHGRPAGSGGAALAAPMLLATTLMAIGSLIAAVGAHSCANGLSSRTRR